MYLALQPTGEPLSSAGLVSTKREAHPSALGPWCAGGRRPGRQPGLGPARAAPWPARARQRPWGPLRSPTATSSGRQP
eukprot:8488496-Alexandrium_andersonii.AAC.1